MDNQGNVNNQDNMGNQGNMNNQDNVDNQGNMNNQDNADNQGNMNNQDNVDNQDNAGNQGNVNNQDNVDNQENQEIEDIKEFGTAASDHIQVISIIGEIEGHDCLSQNAKTTKYEHMLPLLAEVERKKDVRGILFLMNTVGGDVSCGLALAEMIASLSKPTVSLVIGDSHSIGVPLAVATDYSFIVPSATMIIHPVRMSGLVLGTPQTYSQFQQIQDRILGFIASHSKAEKSQLEDLMMNTSMLSRDLGTVLVGKEAVTHGLIQEVGGISRAYKKLQMMMKEMPEQ